MPPKPPSPPRLTHFLCIPLITRHSKPQLLASISTFKKDVTLPPSPEYPDRICIPEAAIRPLGTLHLTLGVMSLVGEERVRGALECLRSVDLGGLLSASVGDGDASSEADVKKGKIGMEMEKQDDDDQNPAPSPQLKITLQSLHAMHLPFQTSILYTSPASPTSPSSSPSNSSTNQPNLQTFCQSLKDHFTSAGFLIPENRPLLLHATIVNTIYVPGVRSAGGRGKEGHGKRKAKMTFDARGILERYEGFEWMRDVRVEKVAICKMGAKKREDGNEEYEVEGEVNMP